jgi:hypothetical protein
VGSDSDARCDFAYLLITVTPLEQSYALLSGPVLCGTMIFSGEVNRCSGIRRALSTQPVVTYKGLSEGL